MRIAGRLRNSLRSMCTEYPNILYSMFVLRRLVYFHLSYCSRRRNIAIDYAPHVSVSLRVILGHARKP